jgi:cold shock protein
MEAPPSEKGGFCWSEASEEKGGLQHMAQGTLRHFNEQKGYGFIAPDHGGGDVFVHYSDIEGAGVRSLEEGEKVTYEVPRARKGMQAQNVFKA